MAAIPPPYCGLCSGGTFLSVPPYGATNVVERGQIRFLPKNANIPAESCCWNLSQPTLNDFVFGHPCVIRDITPCRHLVFCLPITSFGSTSLAVKFKGDSRLGRLRDWFMEITAECGGPRANGDTAHLLKCTGPAMKKSSYVSTGEGFWIEPDYLPLLDGKSRRLNPSSLARFSAAVDLSLGKSNPLTGRPRSPSPPQASLKGLPWGYCPPVTGPLPSPPLSSSGEKWRGRPLQTGMYWRGQQGLPTPPCSRSPPLERGFQQQDFPLYGFQQHHQLYNFQQQN